jgi:hypothetical protein
MLPNKPGSSASHATPARESIFSKGQLPIVEHNWPRPVMPIKQAKLAIQSIHRCYANRIRRNATMGRDLPEPKCICQRKSLIQQTCSSGFRQLYSLRRAAQFRFHWPNKLQESPICKSSVSTFLI